MEKLRILLTGAGAPGFASILNCLRNNGERDLYVVGVDMNPMANGRSKVDSFYQVPKASDITFIDTLLEICRTEKIDVLVSIITKELEVLSLAKKRFKDIGTAVAVMDYAPLRIANNKALLLTAMKKAGLPTPAFEVVTTPDQLYSAVEKLGYPEKAVVIKPTSGNGSRGTRILDASKSRYNQFFFEKPNSMYASLTEVKSIIEERKEIPEMMVMEYLPKEDISVDILAKEGETLYCSCKEGVVVSSNYVSCEIKYNEKAAELAKAVTKLLKLDGNISFDMKANIDGVPQVMEINPRLPGASVCSVISGVNFPYLGIKLALGEKLPDSIAVDGYRMERKTEELLYAPDGSLIQWEIR